MAISIPIIASFDGRGVRKAVADFKRLEGAGNKMQFALLNSNAVVNKGIAQFAKFGAIGAGVAGVIGGKLVQAALESQKVMKQTEAIIRATGGAANLTAIQVSALSEKLSLQTGVDDELIQTSMNLLLTFKQVQDQVGAGNDIFTRASMAALDLGNVFGSTDAAAKMLGKALSNPVKGISALTRAGVNFTDAQKQQIKVMVDSGNVLGAQKLILKEVESQVGGTAKATATAFDLMKVAVGNVAEDFGGLLLPIVERFATFVTNVVVPKMSEFAKIVGEQGLGAGFRFLGGEILNVIPKLGGFADGILAIGTAFVIFKGVVLAATIATALFNVTLLLNPVGIAIAAIIGFIAIMGALMIRFKGVREVVTTVFNIMLKGVEFFVNRAVSAINLFIRAYNLIPFLNNVKTLDHVSLSFGKVGKAAQASAADFRKFEEAQKKITNKTLKPIGISGGGGASVTDKAKTAIDKYTSALKLFISETKAVKDALKDLQKSQLSLANATDDVRVAQEKFNKISQGFGVGSKEAIQATRGLSDARRSAIRATLGLRDATRSVADAQKEYDDLVSGKGIATAKEELSIADDRVSAAQQALEDSKRQYRSYDDQANATEVLNNALDAQREARKKVTEEQEKVNPQAIADAQQKITDAVIDEEDARIALSDAQQEVIDKQNELNEVVNGAATDSQKYKDAQKELTDAQDAERDAVDALTEAYDKQAQAIRDLAEAKDKLTIAAKGTTAKQEAKVQAGLGINLAGGAGVSVGGLPSLDFSNIDFSNIDLSGLNIPMMANGGIVNKPTLAMIGESGAEAVIPLSQMGNTGTTYNITVNAGITATPAQIGQQIIDAIKIAERKSGKVFLSA